MNLDQGVITSPDDSGWQQVENVKICPRGQMLSNRAHQCQAEFQPSQSNNPFASSFNPIRINHGAFLCCD